VLRGSHTSSSGPHNSVSQGGTSMDIKGVVFVLAIIGLIAGAMWYFAAEPTATTTTTSSVTSAATTSETPSPIAP
jgi:hypothetical protein